MPSPLLEIRDLTVSLGPRTLVAGVSFEIDAAAIVALFGESGCGKTTLANALLRLLPPEFALRGSVRFRAAEVLAMNEHALEAERGGGTALIPQDPLLALNPVLRVGDQVAEVARAHGTGISVASLFDLVGLSAPRLRSAYPHQLSGGERQRVLLAQALAGRPALIVADEPFTALDPVLVIELCALMKRLRESMGTAFLVIGHDPGVLAHVADSVVVMHAGRVVERGPSPALFHAPADPYTAGLLRYAV